MGGERWAVCGVRACARTLAVAADPGPAHRERPWLSPPRRLSQAIGQLLCPIATRTAARASAAGACSCSLSMSRRLAVVLRRRIVQGSRGPWARRYPRAGARGPRAQPASDAVVAGVRSFHRSPAAPPRFASFRLGNRAARFRPQGRASARCVPSISRRVLSCTYVHRRPPCVPLATAGAARCARARPESSEHLQQPRCPLGIERANRPREAPPSYVTPCLSGTAFARGHHRCAMCDVIQCAYAPTPTLTPAPTPRERAPPLHRQSRFFVRCGSPGRAPCARPPASPASRPEPCLLAALSSREPVRTRACPPKLCPHTSSALGQHHPPPATHHHHAQSRAFACAFPRPARRAAARRPNARLILGARAPTSPSSTGRLAARSLSRTRVPIDARARPRPRSDARAWRWGP